jgi:hypothetical protein
MRFFTTARFEERLATFVHRRVRDLKRVCGRELDQLERCVQRCASDTGYIFPGGDLHTAPNSGPYWSRPALRSAAATDAPWQTSCSVSSLSSTLSLRDRRPASRRRLRELKRHVIRVSDGLDLVHTNVREERERGTPFTADTARKIEGYARFGVGEG